MKSLWPWQRTFSPVVEKDREENLVETTETETETTSLLIGTPPTAGFENPSTNHPPYDSMTQNNGTLDEIQPLNLRESSSVLFLFLSAVVLIAVLFSWATVWVVNEHEPPGAVLRDEEAFPMLLLPKFVYAPDIVNASTTFSELAPPMLLAWYAIMLSQLPIFTPTVMPGDVYTTRKIMLKTCDLVDVFSPVYPNTTGDMEDQDMWLAIRNQLDQGYTVVGIFQDLHNAHVRYSQEELDELRNMVLDWKSDFEEFRQMHDVPAFLAAPRLDSFYHKESRLFWKKDITFFVTDMSGPRGHIRAICKACPEIMLSKFKAFSWYQI